MAKPDETAGKEPETPWGTWEELLLACAVNRYGTKSWDSVAIEIQKRSSPTTLHNLLTPHHCKQKFHDLKRRYTPKQNHQNDAVPKSRDVDPDDDDKTNTETIPWLDELRKLRVAELKREVERYDLSIVSLQLKVKRLKEEREESENGGEKSDLEKSEERERAEEENSERKTEPEKLLPEPPSGKESDRDNQSVSESNSTDPKGENLETGGEVGEKGPEPVRVGDVKPEPGGGSVKLGGEESCDGSSDSIAKEPVRETVKVEPEDGASESPELWESVAESKGGGEEGAKENSDVQSSASKSRKEGSDKVQCGSNSNNECENKDQSPAVKGMSVESHTFDDFLEIVRCHKLASVFEGRLEIQETLNYRNLIRKHVDLETIQRRLQEGWYSDCNHKFFRDLLLLVNNVIVFFGKKSVESVAAIELRQFISKQMAQKNVKVELSAEKQTSEPPVSLPPKQAPEPSDSLLLKPKIAGPMIVCRKRSSIEAKVLASSSGSDRKREQTVVLTEEKPVVDLKQPSNSSVISEKHRVTKKRTRDRFASGSRSSKKNSKNPTNTNANKNSEVISNQNQSKGGSPSEHTDPKSEKKNQNQSKGGSTREHSEPKSEKKNQNQSKGGSSRDHSEPKTEKKNHETMVDVKKRSAANFLNRMKRSSSSNNGSLLDTLKSSVLSAENSKGAAEQKRSGNRKGDGRKEQVSKRSSGGRQSNKEQSSPAKRNVGRPPKRAAAPLPLSAVLGKRSREVGETEAVASKQPKKRSRK